MEIGVGLDGGLRLSSEEQVELSQEAARLGYTSIWTNEGSGQDMFQVCAQRWAASREVVPEGIATGIAVSPVMYRSPVAFAMSGGTLSQLTGGRFYMGIGSGGAYRPRSRQSMGLPRLSALAMMRGLPDNGQGTGGRRGSRLPGRRGNAAGNQTGHRPAAADPRLPGCAGAGDAAVGRGARRRGLPELVQPGGRLPGAGSG